MGKHLTREAKVAKMTAVADAFEHRVWEEGMDNRLTYASKRSCFTIEELAAMRAADAEIDRSFRLTQADIELSRKLDRAALIDRMPNKIRRAAAQQKAWYEANREKAAAQKKAWYEANREREAARKKAWYEANREKIAAQQKAYREARKKESS